MESPVSEEVAQGLAEAGVDTLERFKIRYRNEILRALEDVPRPRRNPLAPMEDAEREREYDRRRAEVVHTLWMRYRVITLRRIVAARRMGDGAIPITLFPPPALA